VAPASELSSDKVCLGRIGAPYGIKGWVKMISFTQPRENLLSYRVFDAGSGRLLEMDAGKQHGKGLIGHFVGYDTPEAARELAGVELKVTVDELPKLNAGDYYWHQLTGLEVVNRSGVLLGRIHSLLETGANDVLVVEATDDSIDDRQRLLPWLPEQVVLNVDLVAGQMLVDWEPDWLS
jgi:16S rRNA processing protein RimM